jgi:hypothetical protein
MMSRQLEVLEHPRSGWPRDDDFMLGSRTPTVPHGAVDAARRAHRHTRIADDVAIHLNGEALVCSRVASNPRDDRERRGETVDPGKTCGADADSAAGRRDRPLDDFDANRFEREKDGRGEHDADGAREGNSPKGPKTGHRVFAVSPMCSPALALLRM